MKEIKAILVEDEKNVRKGLMQMLQTFCPDVQIVGEAGSLKEAIKLSKTSIFDLVFLDIELPDGSGIDFLKTVHPRTFQVIFVTAYHQYAIDAFRLSAADYLLKPIHPEHLVEAVKKVSAMHSKTVTDTALSLLLHNWSGQESKMMLKDADNIYIVKVKEILHCVADGGYTHFFLASGQKILTSLHLKAYEKMLSKWGFIRSHHSHLVNYNHITRFSKSDGGVLVLSDGTAIPVSSRKKEQLLKTLQELSGG